MRVQNDFFKKCNWANKIEGTLFAMCLKRQVSHPLEVGQKNCVAKNVHSPTPLRFLSVFQTPARTRSYCVFVQPLMLTQRSFSRPFMGVADENCRSKGFSWKKFCCLGYHIQDHSFYDPYRILIILTVQPDLTNFFATFLRGFRGKTRAVSDLLTRKLIDWTTSFLLSASSRFLVANDCS